MDRTILLHEHLTTLWAEFEPYFRPIKAFFGRKLVQYYLEQARRRAGWALLIFLLWRLLPVAYESAIFPLALDPCALQAATTRASADPIRREIMLEAED